MGTNTGTPTAPPAPVTGHAARVASSVSAVARAANESDASLSRKSGIARPTLQRRLAGIDGRSGPLDRRGFDASEIEQLSTALGVPVDALTSSGGLG